VRPLLILLAWAYLSVVLSLVAWVGLGTLVTGWQPTLVTGDSMRPGISAGDVVLVARDRTTDVGLGTVVVFMSADDETVMHRVVAIESDGQLVTKGDANGSTDQVISRDQVVGTVRLMIPRVGLPLLWLRQDGAVLLGLWLLLTLAAVTATIPARSRSAPDPTVSEAGQSP
jgi:signal peptidase I